MNRNEIISTFSLIAQADAINRYSRDRVSIEESVLTHTGWIVMWLAITGYKLEKEGNIKLDWGKLMLNATIHDMDEIGTGDIPRPTKYATSNSKLIFDDIALRYIQKLDYLHGANIYDRWVTAKDKETTEGRLLALADLCAVTYKVWDEIIRNSNMSFMRVALELEVVIYNVNFHMESIGIEYEWISRTLGELNAIVQAAISKNNQLLGVTEHEL